MLSGIQTFAQTSSEYTTTYSSNSSSADPAVVLAVMLPLLLFALVFAVLSIIGMWKMFTKAGKPGWASLIPIYNMVVWCQIVGRPAWWVILLFVPGVNVVINVILCLDLAKAFGKDTLYGILIYLFQPIMFIVLGFGKDQYVGPVAEEGVAPAPTGASTTGQPVPPATAPETTDTTQPSSTPSSEENTPPKFQ